MSFEAIQFDRKTGHNYMLATHETRQQAPSFVARRCAALALAFSVLTGVALSIDRATATDTTVCVTVDHTGDLAARKAAHDLRELGVEIPTYQEVSGVLTEAGYPANTSPINPTSICATDHGGVFGGAIDHLEGQHLKVGTPASNN